MQLPNGSLMVNLVQKNDAGEYGCIAANRFQRNTRKSISGHLQVIPIIKSLSNRKPQIVSKYRSSNEKMVVNTYLTGNVHLYCFANGYPKPTIRWEVPYNSKLQSYRLRPYNIAPYNIGTPISTVFKISNLVLNYLRS